MDGHVRELHIEPGGSCENNDLTVLSKSTVLPAPGTALDGYWGLDGSQHVNYIGTDGYVHETQRIETLPSRDYSPITAFEFNIVGGGNGASAVFSSGTGIITYTASTPVKFESAAKT